MRSTNCSHTYVHPCHRHRAHAAHDALCMPRTINSITHSMHDMRHARHTDCRNRQAWTNTVSTCSSVVQHNQLSSCNTRRSLNLASEISILRTSHTMRTSHITHHKWLQVGAGWGAAGAGACPQGASSAEGPSCGSRGAGGSTTVTAAGARCLSLNLALHHLCACLRGNQLQHCASATCLSRMCMVFNCMQSRIARSRFATCM